MCSEYITCLPVHQAHKLAFSKCGMEVSRVSCYSPVLLSLASYISIKAIAVAPEYSLSFNKYLTSSLKEQEKIERVYIASVSG